MHKKNLNIVVVGKSGAGKSSLLNYLAEAEKDIFEAGIGKPITQSYFEVHSYTNPINNITYNLFDTKGIEPGYTEEFISEVEGKIEKFKESSDFFEHLHTLYYCIDASSKRVEPFEENFIKKMSKTLDVVIVLTKVDLITTEELEGFYEVLKNDLNASEKDIDAHIRITKVCSVAQKTRKGISEKFGREEVLKHSFVGLWNTFAKTISEEIYNVAYLSVYIPRHISELLTERHLYVMTSFQKRLQFEQYWDRYFEDVQVFGNRIALWNILLFPELKEFGLEFLEKEDKIILKSILQQSSILLSKFNQYHQNILKFKKDIKMEAEKVLYFYAEITGKRNDTPISLSKSYKKLDEINLFLSDHMKPLLSAELDACISNISLEDLKDGWFSSRATEEKERFIDIFDKFLYGLSQARVSLNAQLKDFENICATELESYGRYFLNMTEENNDVAEYEKEVRFALQDDGTIDSSERRMLERFKRTKTTLSEEQANEIEFRVAKDFKN